MLALLVRCWAALVLQGLAGWMLASANATPTVDELKQAARGQYQHPEVTAIQIQPSATSRLADTISRPICSMARTAVSVQQTNRRFSARIEEFAHRSSAPRTVADIDNVRQVLGDAAKERDAAGQLTRQAVASKSRHRPHRQFPADAAAD